MDAVLGMLDSPDTTPADEQDLYSVPQLLNGAGPTVWGMPAIRGSKSVRKLRFAKWLGKWPSGTECAVLWTLKARKPRQSGPSPPVRSNAEHPFRIVKRHIDYYKIMNHGRPRTGHGWTCRLAFHNLLYNEEKSGLPIWDVGTQ